ncbi:hemolysin family protein [uncultured Adlercreutzia sp.]|uniref:hemolysin family protein n=2 Tax=uncultured Adlercreutzia sp. TaxID=875803 RepID=UPI0025DD3FA2|nr:hemolysin family protein [uncultured Adlercreutzia sp.]
MSKTDRTDDAVSKPTFLDFLRANRRENVSEDEIKDMVAENAELLDDEKRMINDILDLSDMTVREIMKPRVDMIMVEDTESARTALDRMRGTGYSRLPVYHEEIDDVIGIVYYKDLISPLMDGRLEEPVIDYMFEPYYVPETKNVLPLLSELQAEHQQMAIVVDEYGGTDGLITMEDIVEEIVGEIIDESDNDRDLVILLNPDQWRADGRLPVEDAMELGWPLEESDDYETLAGWIIHTLDSVPKVGDELVVAGFAFKVEKMRRSRISIVRVTRLPEASCEETVTAS